MLELVVERIAEPPSEDDELLSLQVANVGGGARATYRADLLPSTAAFAILENYPRWSEPAGALCTRLLHAALKSEPAVARGEFLSEFRIIVRLVPHGRGPARVLESYRVQRDGPGWLVTGAHGSCVVPDSRSTPVAAAALRALKHVYWRGQRIPRARRVIPRIYQHGTIPFIRINELPEPARSAFHANMARSGRPFVPHAPDAVFAWDWADFEAGGR